MSLMDKFSAVEIKADDRISEEDKVFCQRQQEAFDKSGSALQRIADLMVSASTEQKEIMAVDEDTFYSPYLRCDTDSIYNIMKGRNEVFISAIVNYFSQKYKVELSICTIKEHLIPEKPSDSKLSSMLYHKRLGDLTDEERAEIKQKSEEYHHMVEEHEMNLRSLPLRYEQIVDEIFVQLGGFSFQEQAMNELLRKCWTAAHRKDWHNNILKEDFDIKNDTIKFTNYWCHFDISWSTPRWSVSDGTKHMLDALAHYICGRHGEGYRWFPELFDYRVEGDGVFPSFHPHVKQIKLFKNGRMDIKFRSAAEAIEFADNYLRKNV